MEQTVEAVKNNLPGKPALKLNFGAKFYKPFWFKASACRHGEFIERTGAKTIANVRTVDECVKRMNGVFSLENTESEYKKGDNLPTSRR